MRRNLLVLLLWNAIVPLGCAAGGSDAPPPAASPREVKFALPRETKLENGLRVIVAERRGLPLLAVRLVIRQGSEVDPANLAGTASITGSLLTRGTETMSAPQIATAIESLGGMIFANAGWDSSTAGVVIRSDQAEPALRILADVVMHPAFQQQEIDRLRAQRLDQLRVALQQPGSLLSYVATQVSYPTGEYAHPAGGTLETLPQIKREDIVKLYQTCYRPENAFLIFVGDITLEQGETYARKLFGSWRVEQAAPDGTPPGKSGTWKPQAIAVDVPEAGQAAVSILRPAIKRDSPEYYAGLVTNAALGEGFVSRLNREIRIRRGLSYGASSYLDTRRDAGSFGASAQTKNESAAEVAGLLQSEVKRLATQPVEGTELKSRQAVLIGEYARSMETNLGVAGQVASLATYNLPLDTLDKFVPAIDSVTGKDIAAFTSKYLDQSFAVIIVGKASAFVDALKKTEPDLRVIPQSQLDLNRPSLEKEK